MEERPTNIQNRFIFLHSSGVCKFEKDLCSWTNALNDDGDWKIHKHETPSLHTGPQYDSDGNGTGLMQYLYTYVIYKRVFSLTMYVRVFECAYPCGRRNSVGVRQCLLTTSCTLKTLQRSCCVLMQFTWFNLCLF